MSINFFDIATLASILLGKSIKGTRNHFGTFSPEINPNHVPRCNRFALLTITIYKKEKP